MLKSRIHRRKPKGKPMPEHMARANAVELAPYGIRVNSLTPSDEAKVLRAGIKAIEAVTGKRPAGYRCPSGAFSPDTLNFLLDEGFAYDASLSGDDVPQSLVHNIDRVAWILKEQTPKWCFGLAGRSASFGEIAISRRYSSTAAA